MPRPFKICPETIIQESESKNSIAGAGSRCRKTETLELDKTIQLHTPGFEAPLNCYFSHFTTSIRTSDKHALSSNLAHKTVIFNTEALSSLARGFIFLPIISGNTGVKGLLCRQHSNRAHHTSKEAQFNTEQSCIDAQNICPIMKRSYYFLNPSM